MESFLNLTKPDEERFNRIISHQNLEGLIITNENGQLLHTTLDNNLTFMITSKLLAFSNFAETVIRDLNPADKLLSCRIQMRNKEAMIITPPDSLKIIAFQKLEPSRNHGHLDNHNEEHF